jgi:hypothetical protein
MKIYILSLFVAFAQLVSAQVIAPGDKPNTTQKLLIERGYGMFIVA